MDRREFLLRSIAFGSAIILGGCGGNGRETVSSGPMTINVALKKEEQNHEEIIEIRVVSVPDDTSVLEAVKRAFPYEREAPLENANNLTTIGGIPGHWRYEVNGFEPRVNARDWPITSDCDLNLILFSN